MAAQGRQDPEFDCPGPALLRAATLPSSAGDRGAAGVSGALGASGEGPAVRPVAGPDDEPGMRAHVAALAAVPELMTAVALASPSLAHDVRRIAGGHPVRAKVLRRVTLALTKYHLRMTERPTPFGLFAGVALADFGAQPRLDAGGAHRTVSRPDAGWLQDVLELLLTERAVLRRTRLVASNLHTVRDGRLELVDAHSSTGSRELVPSVRYTSVVRTVMEAAGEPVAWDGLLQQVRDRFPRATPEAAEGCLEQLVRGGFLLTDLTPPPDCGTPLDHVLDRLGGLAHPVAGELRAIRAALSAFDAAPPAERPAALAAATDRMRALAPAESPLQCDLAFDARLTLPADVGREAARATAVLWRLAPGQAGDGDERIRAYYARFLERYGTEQLVPVLELLDEARGLGLPRSPAADSTHDPAAARTRDRLLGELLWDAARRGAHEIVLDEHTVEQLAHDGPRKAPQSIDVGAEVVAEDWEALCAGDFRLVLGLGPVSHLATAAFGRFAPALGAPATARIRNLAEQGREADGDGNGDGNGAGEAGRDEDGGGDRDGEADKDRGGDRNGEADKGGDGRIAAAIAFRPTVARSANVATVPQWPAHRIPLGVGPASAAGAQDLRLDDLAVLATTERLELVHTPTGQRVRPMSYSMLNPRSGHFPHVARFLVELGRQGEEPYGAWSWGTWTAAPALPRIRYGRSVLCPARWRPDEALAAAAAGGDDVQWAGHVQRWRQRWSVPRHVLLGKVDHRIPVDLDDPLHLMVFRDELRRTPGLAVLERFGGAPSNGWFRGPGGPHSCELVFPVFPRRRTPAPPARPGRATAPAAHRTRGGHGRPPRHLPGGEWLYAKLYVPERHQPTVLASHFGRLSSALQASAGEPGTWFFLRYTDPDPHLRVRFHGKPEALWTQLLPSLQAWAAELTDAGLLARLALDTYEPEVHRYGGAAALAHAERVFHTDSAAVLHQLARADGPLTDLPPVSAAALGVLDILSHLCTPAEMLHHLGTEQVLALRGSVQRADKNTLGALLDPQGRAAPHMAGARWEARRAALRALRDELRGELRATPQDTAADLPSVAMSLAHMHCNRLLGIDRDKELLTYATAREALALRLGRTRHGR
ncbi:lantibiotic dehydratase [Streptomyces roseoverticillatus]|uniref:lantibiotic dehydratase n=1 Tax=Streptomyces roseoverticillatus TaxID=66429 RepID=UPI001F261242|nr:lantibiotic dehydratase [Streptomyces roseoverticillatus]MCF3106549.1 lantibiotic dehydratase [Streptomyces roseoverticillatus]